jgi:hypothetical protein
MKRLTAEEDEFQSQSKQPQEVKDLVIEGNNIRSKLLIHPREHL